MSEAGTVVPKPAAAQAAPRDGGMQNRVTELKVSGHLMTLDTGLFCVFQAPGTPAANDGSGLPGVRISLPPGPAGRPDAVSISTFRDDGWMNGSDTADTGPRGRRAGAGAGDGLPVAVGIARDRAAAAGDAAGPGDSSRLRPAAAPARRRPAR